MNARLELLRIYLQAISKMQITFNSKLSFAKSRHSGARADEKAQHT